MQYSISELIFYLFIYGFLGWCMEVAVMAMRTGKFSNRGFFNLPVCPSYGAAMVILIVFMPRMSRQPVFSVIACVIVISAAAYIAGGISRRLMGTRKWAFESISIFAGDGKNLACGLCIGALGIAAAELVQPFVFLAVRMIPGLPRNIIAAFAVAIMAADAFSVVCSARKAKRIPLEDIMEDVGRAKARMGRRVSMHVLRRLDAAYPESGPESGPEAEAQEKGVFARGLCMDKLIWVFMICALAGDMIETVFVGVTAGKWMSRSSVIYGPFSIVWGAGGVLLTVLLQRIARRGGFYVFIAGCLLGGVYEYMCSVFTEIFLGTTFWDYSDVPFNIGGRTHLMFCVYWGMLGLVWVKACYPLISGWIERIPRRMGKTITWLVVVLMGCNMIISGAAVIRYVDRMDNPAASGAIEAFIDHHYDDALMAFIYPNMRVDARLVAG